MRFFAAIFPLLCTPLLPAVEWSIDQCSALDLLAGRTGIADVRPSNDPHLNSDQMVEQNSGIYRGQWSWQSEMPELLYDLMNSGDVAKVSPSGFTPLQAACVYADEGIFQALMDAGVPVDNRPADWQQLGYVGDTPLGLLVRFMSPRSASARLRMARVLLEKGADPDAPMTTWRGNRVVAVSPFCELGSQDYNHELRLLLLQFGNRDLAARMAAWQLNWEWYRDDLVQYLQQNGVLKTASESPEQLARKAMVGRVPLLDLIRKGDVEGVRMALEAGVSIEVSDRARRYGQEPLFNIPARRKDSPEVAVEIARLLVEAGADVNALNRRGRSLRIHYDRYHSKASRALCAYFKSQGAFIHPDSPENKKIIEQRAAEKARLAQLAQPVTVPEAQEPVVQPETASQPAPVLQPEPETAPQSAPVLQPEPETAPQPAPAPQPEPETAPQPAPVLQPEPETAAQPAPAPQPESEPMAASESASADAQKQRVLLNLQQQLQGLQLVPGSETQHPESSEP